MATYTDNFPDDPYVSRWAWRYNGGAWDATNADLDLSTDNGPVQVVYISDLGSIAHEAQVTFKGAGSGFGNGPGPLVRSAAASDDGYSAEFVDYTGGGTSAIRFRRFNNSGSPTTIAEVPIPNTFTNNGWYTIRLAAEGGNGADVVLSAWLLDHGAGSKPADPGWIGVVGAPDATYTDTDGGNRLNGSSQVRAGIGGGGPAPDSSHDWWKARDISERGGGGRVTKNTRRSGYMLGTHLGMRRGC